jgi:hypothetical protein
MPRLVNSTRTFFCITAWPLDSRTLLTPMLELEIFRFLKLPIELRLHVYDYTIKAKHKLHYKKDNEVNKDSWLALNLRGVNKQINQETHNIFLKNNFRITDSVKNWTMYQVHMAIAPIIRVITFEWWAWANKDPQALFTMRSFVQLKVLNLIITKFCIQKPTLQSQRRQYQYQGRNDIMKFSRSNGFDALVALRGLEKVNVSNSTNKDTAADRSDISLREIDQFAAFLNECLTQPKLVEKPAEPVSTLSPPKFESNS